MKLYRLSGVTFYYCINTIYQFIKPFLDNRMSIFEEYWAFKADRKDSEQHAHGHTYNIQSKFYFHVKCLINLIILGTVFSPK